MKDQKIKLVVGLGNWPKEYAKTRHNIGFIMIDAYCKEKNLKLTKAQFNGNFDLINHGGNKAIIAKPLTLMNLSGEFVQKIMNYYKISIHDILVISDDVNLDLGKIRLRPNGSSGGQNGLKNIIHMLGSEDFKRLRIGIGRPNSGYQLVNYVLGEFTSDDFLKLKITSSKVNEIIDGFLDDLDFQMLMNKYN